MSAPHQAADPTPIRGCRAGKPIDPEILKAYEPKFWLKVNKTDQCWIWTANRRNGYGQIVFRGRGFVAHRFAYALLVGPIPTGLTLDHLCRNRACVNPAHLEPVTNRENVLRGDVYRGVRDGYHLGGGYCKRGHEFTPENTIRLRNGYRRCRACKAAWDAANWRRRRAQAVSA